MAMYGDVLSYFPELKEELKIYKSPPGVVAGRGKRKLVGSFWGIVLTLKTGDLSEKGEVLSTTEVPTIWTRKKLKQGTLVARKEEDELLMVGKSLDFKRTGNFCVFTLESLAGVTDIQKSNPDVNLGLNNYD